MRRPFLLGWGFLLALEWGVPALIVALVWLWSARAGSFAFPPLDRILMAFRQTWLGPGFLDDAIPSLRRWALAYLLAVLLGVAGGVPMGLSATARNLFGPVLELIRATPPPAIFPIAMIALGIGDTMKVATIALVCLFPILLSTADGVREVDQTMRDVARAYRLPMRAELFRIILPAASPRIFAGLRTSCSLGLVLIVLSEMFGATDGIGYRILASLRSFALPQMWSGVILLGLLGYAVNIGFDQLERRALAWHMATRPGSRT